MGFRPSCDIAEGHHGRLPGVAWVDAHNCSRTHPTTRPGRIALLESRRALQILLCREVARFRSIRATSSRDGANLSRYPEFGVDWRLFKPRLEPRTISSPVACKGSDGSLRERFATFAAAQRPRSP